MNKDHNKKYTTPDGQVFDSKKEYRRYTELMWMQKAGEIEDLQRQIKFVLIPGQYEDTDEVYTKGKRKGEKKQGTLLERECAYYADFTYKVNGELIVEDTKGVRTADYILKRKMMLYFYGVKIKEV